MISICISTFNRANLLAEMLDSLSRSAATCPDVVTECVVALNGCTDDTAQVLDGQSRRLLGYGIALRYFCNPHPLIVAESYARAVAAASNRLVWLFSDDDVIMPSALLAIKTALTQGTAFIALNWQSYEYDLQHSIGAPAFVNHGGKHESLRGFLLGVGIHCISFISALIVQREAWLNSTVLRTHKYDDTNYEHICVLIETFYSLPVVAIEEVCVKNRFNYRVDQLTRRQILLAETMKNAWSAVLKLVQALSELNADQEIVSAFKRHYVQNGVFLFQYGLIKAYCGSEFRSFRQPFDSVFRDVPGYRIRAAVSSIVPKRVFLWLANHRALLRVGHRGYVRARGLFSPLVQLQRRVGSW